MKRRIVLLGPPASGKGTQAEMISAKYGIPSASPGAMLREEKATGTKLGFAADQMTRLGKLVPDETVCEVVSAWLKTHDGQFIFDGFPRSFAQADSLAAMLEARRTPLEVALFLAADFETIARRVLARLVCTRCRTNVSLGLHVADPASPCPKCGGKLVRRSDDNLKTLQLRMQEYGEKTQPLVAHYDALGLLKEVDSTQAPDVVFASIVDILEG